MHSQITATTFVGFLVHMQNMVHTLSHSKLNTQVYTKQPAALMYRMQQYT